MFHSDHPVKSAGVDVLEDISVVDLARARFFASWIVSHLKITNLVPAPFNVLDEIAFSNLLMVDVEQYLAGGAVDCLTNGIGLRRTLQEDTSMISKPVQRL